MLLDLTRAAVAVVAPPACGLCGKPTGGDPVCEGCRRALGALRPLIEPGPPGIALCCAAGRYQGVLGRLVVAIKFQRRIALAACAAKLLADLCPDDAAGEIVPVPAEPLRWHWRGFDPAEELALALAAETGLPMRACLRRGAGQRQAARSRHQRLTRPPRVRAAPPVPESALLVDDVHTTGATLVACAGALRQAGCRRVDILTLARA